MPEFVDDGHPVSIKMFMVSLLGFRTMRMQGESVPEFEPLWNRLRDVCPEWPGFKLDRMDPILIPELVMAKDRELGRLERYLAVCERRRLRREK
ncbi:hypothetical protein RRSWK_01351 [Rhodopirellula sp. SWK7]|nr:hypothetical protein RRSWK_01351 [Rhodopirellula sp. SWK7]